MNKRIFFIFTFIFLTYFLFARDITITVTDADLDLPLEGAVIRTREGLEYFCDEDGKAVIQVPDSRQTSVQALYPGYETGVITIPVSGNLFTIALRLSGLFHGRELVVEAAIPGTSETKTGRSIAVSSREIAQTGEIGIIEDVMNTIKLLPGVSYTGAFRAQPSIRGGHPGDMISSFDGFYINNPYHWGGGFSIFDPRMVQSAQLSHGVFSSRHGHTISGLLDVKSKEPSNTETMFELGMNTSAANFNLSIPLFNKGGILFMGRVTFYDPVILLIKRLSSAFPALDMVNSIRKAPYIRSGTVTGKYRFTEKLELSATGFFGIDGISVYYMNSSRSPDLNTDSSYDFEFLNVKSFLISSFSWNPRRDILVKFLIGTGYEKETTDGDRTNNIIEKSFSDDFFQKYPELDRIANPYNYYQNFHMRQSNLLFSVQGRVDADFELTDRVLLSAGAQEMYSLYDNSNDTMRSAERNFNNLTAEQQQYFSEIITFLNPLPQDSNVWRDLSVNFSNNFPVNYNNNLLTTSAYFLADINLFNRRLKSEIGLRLDHYYIFNNGFSIQSNPVLNPRLNIDFNVLKNAGFLQSLDISSGTGLFSSIDEVLYMADSDLSLEKIKPNRSWTSVIGLKMDFLESLNLNIEGYYKYVFDRMYAERDIFQEDNYLKTFDNGRGRVWGIDVMLQKKQSRYWDGWLSYSLSWAKYLNPGSSSNTSKENWQFPWYHRFHNLNLIFNIKPVQNLNIYIRFGIASGVQLARRVGEKPESYPVLIHNTENPHNSYFIEKYYWESVSDENNRTTPSLPMDIKFSIYGNSKNGKTRYEVYLAVENVLSLLYTAKENTSFNTYTGKVDTGSSTASYEIPVPIPSFGFKFTY